MGVLSYSAKNNQTSSYRLSPRFLLKRQIFTIFRFSIFFSFSAVFQQWKNPTRNGYKYTISLSMKIARCKATATLAFHCLHFTKTLYRVLTSTLLPSVIRNENELTIRNDAFYFIVWPFAFPIKNSTSYIPDKTANGHGWIFPTNNWSSRMSHL